MMLTFNCMSVENIENCRNDEHNIDILFFKLLYYNLQNCTMLIEI